MKIKFPPTARHGPDGGVVRNTQGTVYPMRPIYVSNQPSLRSMSLDTKQDNSEQTVDGAARLRGGCIPCPVCQSPPG